MSDVKAEHPAKAAPEGRLLGVLAVTFGLVFALVIIILGVKIHALNARLTQTQQQLTQAKADAAQTQSELDKAKSASSDLQSQLTDAKKQQADLQAQVDQSKVAANQEVAQLDRYKSESSDLQSQLDKSKAESAALQTQLTQSSAGSAQLMSELDQAKIQSMDQQTKLQKAENDLAQLQPLVQKARHLPITTSLEKARGNRFTLHLSNLYLQPLTVNLTITGPDLTRTQTNVIGAGATFNLEKLAAGEKVAIASDGYDPVDVTVQ